MVLLIKGLIKKNNLDNRFLVCDVIDLFFLLNFLWFIDISISDGLFYLNFI